MCKRTLKFNIPNRRLINNYWTSMLLIWYSHLNKEESNNLEVGLKGVSEDKFKLYNKMQLFKQRNIREIILFNSKILLIMIF